MERQAEIVIRALRFVGVATAVGTPTAEAVYQAWTNTTPIIEAQTVTPTLTPTPRREDCSVEVRHFAQFYQDKGGPTHPDGRPMFQRDIDEILGPAPGRLFMVEAVNGSIRPEAVLLTDKEGRGSVTVNGIADATQDNRRIVRLISTSLDNGDKTNLDGRCGSPVQLDKMVEKGPLQVIRGLVATPRGDLATRVAGSVESLDADKRRAATAVAIEAVREAQRVQTAVVEATAKATRDARASQTASPTATQTPTSTQARAEQSPTPTANVVVPGPEQPKDGEYGFGSWIHDTPIPLVGWVGDRFDNLGSITRWYFDRMPFTGIGTAVLAIGVYVWRRFNPFGGQGGQAGAPAAGGQGPAGPAPQTP